MLKKLKKINKFDLLAFTFCGIFVIAGSIVSILRFWQYDAFYFDFGIYDTAIWKIAHFQTPIIDHFGQKIIFADHFAPSVFLLSPLYWITNRSEILLIVQSLAVGLSGLTLYFIGSKILKNKLTSLSLLVCYFLFLGIQNAVISDFHEVTVATFPLALIFWAIINKKIKLYFLFLILTLGFKESNFILGIIIGFTVFILNRKWWKIAAITSLISVLCGFIAINIIIPYFAKSVYQYSQSISFDSNLLISFFDTPKKIETIFYSLLSFGFLPVFAPIFWPLILQDFFTRFYSSFDTRTGLGLHYSALLSVILAVSSIYGFKFLSSKLSRKVSFVISIIIILNSILLYRFVLRGPFALAYNPAFYRQTQNLQFLNNLVNKVPKDKIVMTQNNLAPHFIHKSKSVLLLRENYEGFKPDFIVMDLRSGQNQNDFFPIDNSKAQKILEKLRKDICYKTSYSTKDQFIFKRFCR